MTKRRIIQPDLFADAAPAFTEGKRRFFEVGKDGNWALNKWAATYVELQDPQFRVAPSPHHIFVSTRSLWPSLVGSAGWLDISEHLIRELSGKDDKAVIYAILQAEQSTARKMERLVAYTRATVLRGAVEG
jgi:hypothetical protein